MIKGSNLTCFLQPNVLVILPLITIIIRNHNHINVKQY